LVNFESYILVGLCLELGLPPRAAILLRFRFVPQTLRSVLLVENDRSIVRQAQSCLAPAGFTLLRPVTTMREALASLVDTAPDVVVMDLNPATDAHSLSEVSACLGRRGTPIVYLSSAADRSTVARAVDAGAAAFIVKPFADGQLVAAVLLAALVAERRGSVGRDAGRLTPDQKLQAIAALVHDVSVAGSPVPAVSERQRPGLEPVSVGSGSHQAVDALSAREREVVDLLANGARVVSIARRLEISQHTVRNHLKSVFRKLDLHGQHELFEYWRSQRPE